MARKRAGRAFVASLLAMSMLSACAENDIVLPGKRESIRSALDTEDVGQFKENETRPISLPPVSANASWAQSPGTPASRTANAALNTPPGPLWSADIGAGDSRKQRITAAPVIAGGRIFTLDAETLVTATSVSGQRVWQTDIRSDRDKSGQATGGGLAVSNGRVFVTSGYGMLVALDAASGQEIWRQRLEGTGSGTPTVVDGIVYLTAGDDRGYALTADEGRLLWSLVSSPDVNNVLGAPAPAVAGDLAVFAFGSGEVQAVFRRGGLRRWDASVSGQRLGTALGNVGDVTGSPLISGKTVYVGNQSGRTVALNLDSGARRWTVEEGAVGQIVAAGDSVFLISDRNELLRLDARDGRRIWGIQLPRFTKDRPKRRSTIFAHHGPVLAGGKLLVASDDGLIRSFDPTNGALVSTVEIPGGATSDPVVAGGVLYVVSTKGKLHAFR